MDTRDLITIRHKNDFSKQLATVILAGGQGTRLYPLTSARCKPSVSFGGRYRLIDVPISNSLNAKINQIFVISQHFASELNHHISTTYQLDIFRSGGLELLTPEETADGKRWFKGTADAVRQCLKNILSSEAEWFMILSGDQLYNMDLLAMLEHAKEKEADLTIASIPVPLSDAKRMGLLKINAATKIVDFIEKPQDQEVLQRYLLPEAFVRENGKITDEPNYLASMGIYVFKRAALVEILKGLGDDFGRDLIPKFIQKGRCSSYIYRGYWEDIGTVASFYAANLLLTEGKGLNGYIEDNQIYSAPQHVPNALISGTRIDRSLIGQGGIIEAEEINHSVIGMRALIKRGTIIRDSIVMGNRSYHSSREFADSDYYSIGENCLIERAIIDEESRIGDGVQLVNKQKLQHYDGEGIYIRDGIIVVPSGTYLPDYFVL